MKYGTNCKFCNKPITIEVDDEYLKLRDPFKLLPMACCNPCADNRVSKRVLEKKIQIICRCLDLAGKNATGELLSSSKSSLTKLTKDYASMIARWHNMDGMAWDDECVTLLMEKPREWAAVLGGLWKLFKNSTK